MLIVEKFGGSSLAGVERVRCAARLIADTVRAGHSVAAVLSAQGKTTDALLSTAAHYSPNPSRRELDMLLATGEQASVALMAMALEEMGLPAVSLTGWQAGVGTDETYGDAHIRRLSMERVRRELSEGKIVLIAGFQGVSPGNDITTLGRGGSDTTAVAAAAALRADECRIYTDVEGVFTADPRLIPEARRLSAVDSEEMLRLASLGSQVLHERSAALALLDGGNIQFHIRQQLDDIRLHSAFSDFFTCWLQSPYGSDPTGRASESGLFQTRRIAARSDYCRRPWWSPPDFARTKAV